MTKVTTEEVENNVNTNWHILINQTQFNNAMCNISLLENYSKHETIIIYKKSPQSSEKKTPYKLGSIYYNLIEKS